MQAYVFRGPCASGKGTLTKAFAKTLSGKVALLELDEFRWRFHLIGRNVGDITEGEHYLAYQNFLSVLENYCKAGEYTLIIEGLFAWDTAGPHGNMQDILALFRRFHVNHMLFLLAAPYEVLWERNAKRQYVVPEDEFKMLHDYVMQKSSGEEIKIDVSGTPEDALRQIEKSAKPPL